MAAKSTKKTTSSEKTTTKKTTAKLSKETPIAETTSTKATDQSAPKGRSLKIRKSYIFTIIGLLILVGLILVLGRYFIAATVNGQIISRLTVIRALENQGGQQALENEITKMLILQEARKKNISIPQTEIDSEMKKIETSLQQQGQTLEQFFEMTGRSKNQLVEEIVLQKTVEKLVPQPKVTDQEVEEYKTNNADSLPEDMPEEELTAAIKERLEQQKLSAEAQTYLENLRKAAKVNYLTNY